MVATLLRLRFRVLGNDLKRSPGQLVGFVIGALGGISALFAIVAGMIALAFTQSLPLTATVIVGVGSLVTLGWVLGPLLVFGIDQTLDPQKLMVFPLPRRQLMVALALAGVVGVPGLVTSAAALSTLVAWSAWPLALAASVVSVPLGVLTAVIASRAVSAVASNLGPGRRFREISGVLIFIPLILAGPIVAGVATGFALNIDTVTTVIDVLAWTPVGAAWGVPAEVAAGHGVAALVKLAIALATLVLVWVLWKGGLARSLASPKQQASVAVEPGKIGWFGRVPATPTGAVFARALTFWLRDPRYQRQLIMVPLFPILLWFYVRNGDVALALSFSAPLIAFGIGITLYTDISFDGTAFASELATGVRGRADRWGRFLAAGVIAVPIVLIAAVLPFFWSGRWELLPAIIGMSAAVLFACYAVSAVSSAMFVMPVPASGDNPFKRVPGATMMQGLSFLAIWGIALVASAPAVVPGLIAVLTGNATLSLITLAVGLVLGAVLLVAGMRVGGTTLDRNGAALLSRMKAMKNV